MIKKRNEVFVVNGPNLNLLGVREPEIYGMQTLQQIIDKLLTLSKQKNVKLTHLQSNHEGVLIDFLNQKYIDYLNNPEKKIAFIINLAAYSHTSIALLDALQMFFKKQIPIIEVHLSDISTRESFRQSSFTSNIASEVITGLGAIGYEKALCKIFDIFDSHYESSFCS